MRSFAATHAHSRLLHRSATGFEPAREPPGKQETTVAHRPEGRGMLHPIRAAARLIDQKIGWSRIGLALSLVIIGTAAIVLYRILRGISLADLFDALKATEWIDALLAALF